MNTVYVVNNSGNDYSKAKVHGELVFLSRGFVDLASEFEDVKERISNLIQDSKPDDVVLLDGSKVLCALVVSLFREKHGKCRVLQWNPTFSARKYELYTI